MKKLSLRSIAAAILISTLLAAPVAFGDEQQNDPECRRIEHDYSDAARIYRTQKVRQLRALERYQDLQNDLWQLQFNSEKSKDEVVHDTKVAQVRFAACGDNASRCATRQRRIQRIQESFARTQASYDRRIATIVGKIQRQEAILAGYQTSIPQAEAAFQAARSEFLNTNICN